MPTETDILRVLCVDCRVAGDDRRLAVTRAATARQVLALLRQGPIDVLLTTTVVGGEPVWPLLERIRRVRPKLAWWLVARGLTADEEILARTLGLTRVLAEVPTAADLWTACRRPNRGELPAHAPPHATLPRWAEPPWGTTPDETPCGAAGETAGETQRPRLFLEARPE